MKCNCRHSEISVVRGNDFSVEARLHIPAGSVTLDLTEASGVALNLVGGDRRISGRDISVSGSTVTAFFPAGSVALGVYGVEITFRDSAGKGRLYERNLIAVVESGSDASAASDSGRIISVDIKTRTITLCETNYGALAGKPSINGVELVGDRSPAELGLVGSAAVHAVAVLTEDAYAALEEKDPYTLYVITRGGDGDEA